MTQATDEAGQQGFTDQASTKVQDAASVVQDKASELREQGTMRLRDQFDRRSNDAGSQMRSLAEALRRSGNDLGDEGNTNASQLTTQAADRIERFGTYLEQKSGNDLMRDVESFARRRPWMLAGLGMLAGIAAARFVKASSDSRYGDGGGAGAGWSSGQRVTGTQGGGLYGRGELTSGVYGTSGSTDPDVASPSSDDPLARDPYASAR